MAAVAGGTIDDVVERVAEAAGANTEEIQEDVVMFVDHLVTLGLLTHG